MKIELEKMNDTVLPSFYGGDGEMVAKIYKDGKNKILKGKLAPGCNIGLHRHETSSEIIFILSGEGRMLFNGKTEPLTAGECHYCPQGSEHSLRNDGEADLIFYAVVPEH
ncbi:MAG: cupin domain-containing protein [Clostridia bacterium]|nr:cupin domain-containing protein [Clostridia bacterium]